MQVFTRIEIEPDGTVSHAEWYEYEGPVALAKGDVNVPGPSAEEKALQSEQASLLKQQRDLLSQMVREQNLLAPYLYEQAGLSPQLNDQGEIVGFTQIADPNKELSQQVETGFLERTLAALRGELPIDPALERELGTQEDVLRNTLRRQLGPGFETSTPGQDALDKFFRSSTELREGARRGDLTLAEQLGLARQQGNELQTTELLNRLFGISGLPGQSIGVGNQIQSGYSAALAPYLQDRQFGLQAAMANQQYKSNTLGQILGVVGTGAGLAGGYALFKP